MFFAYTVGMNTMQYTVRGVTPKLDQALRKRAQISHKSFNQVLLEALNTQVFSTPEPPKNDSFDWLYGAKTLDNNFNQAIAGLSKPDEKMWLWNTF